MIIKEIYSIQRRKGFHLVKWDQVIVDKKNGGLGIKNLNNHSKALRMKWLWKFAKEKQMLWGKVIEAKYEDESKWMTKEINTPYGVQLWRAIRGLWEEFKVNTKIKGNNGEKTAFWKDDWHGAGNLSQLFPDIHNLVMHQQSTIAELWSPEGWNFTFRRQLNDWEVQRAAEFFGTID